MRAPATARLRIGHEITAARKRRGLTQAGLARLVGTSRRTVSRIENGAPGVALDVYTSIAAQIGPLPSFVVDTPPPANLGNFSKWTQVR